MSSSREAQTISLRYWPNLIGFKWGHPYLNNSPGQKRVHNLYLYAQSKTHSSGRNVKFLYHTASYETLAGWVSNYKSQLNYQVWSLAQFFSVDLSQSKIGVKSALDTNPQSRFTSVVFDSVLGPLWPAQHSWQCPCFSVVSEATQEANHRPLKGVSSKSFSRVRDSLEERKRK